MDMARAKDRQAIDNFKLLISWDGGFGVREKI